MNQGRRASFAESEIGGNTADYSYGRIRDFLAIVQHKDGKKAKESGITSVLLLDNGISVLPPIGHLSKLSKIDLSTNCISDMDALLGSFKGLENTLSSLNLAGNFFRGAVSPALRNFPLVNAHCRSVRSIFF